MASRTFLPEVFFDPEYTPQTLLDLGLISKLPPHPNERSNVKFDPKIFKEEDLMAVDSDSDSDSDSDDFFSVSGNAKALLVTERFRRQPPPPPPPPSSDTDTDEELEDKELEDLGMTRDEWNAYLNAYLKEHPGAYPFEAKRKRLYERLDEIEEKYDRGELPFQKPQVTSLTPKYEHDSSDEEEGFVGGFRKGQTAVNSAPKGFGREENFIKQDPAKHGIKSAKAGKKQRKKRIKSAN